MQGRIKNWSEFQHYKDRSPPWIKLHRSFLDNYEFACLPIASKALAPLLWLLAAESSDGSVRIDPEWLAFRLRWPIADVEAGLKPLCDGGFVEVDSELLAERLRDACLETEGETETEGEEMEPSGSSSPAKADAIPDCPQAEIVALYHELLPTHRRMRVWDGERAKALRSRWREDPKRQTLDYWRRFFAYVAQSPFLTGQVESKDRPPFVADLEWLVTKKNFIKVIERKYHDGVQA